MKRPFGPVYAAHYDRIYRGKGYAAECDLLERLFRAHAPGAVRTVLDLGCGTGTHAVELARRGYRVRGVDGSPHMLRAARAKARAAALAPPPEFVRADLRGFRGGEPADAVLMMFAVLGYLWRDDDLRAGLAAVAANLAPGGLFVFDVWYGPAVEAQRPSARSSLVDRDAAGEVHRVAAGELDRATRTCWVSLGLERRRGGERTPLAAERHRMRYFDRPELERELAAAGLELVRLAAFPELDRAPDTTTWNVLGVARRSADAA